MNRLIGICFQCRLSESLCVTGRIGCSSRRTPVSYEPTSSRTSTISGLYSLGEFDGIGDDVSESAIGDENDGQVEKSVAVDVCGVAAPGSEIVHDLFGLLERRVEAVLLKTITMTLARNPKSKLDAADVQVTT